ncbi:MAG: glycosyltransferase family 39 protein [Thermoanaerobaculia bacterium]|nr:glycosyltransferase family 39 protein [Thermoanaerobaculia bacterium]
MDPAPPPPPAAAGPPAAPRLPAQFVACTALFALALGVRLLYLWQSRTSPFFHALLGDCARYDAWAREIAAGAWLGDRVFYQAPLYPYFLAGVYRTLGDDLVTVRLVQSLLGAASCVLLALAAERFFDRRAALAAGALLALYPTALFFDQILQKSTLDLFLLCLLLATVARALRRGAAAWFVAGLAAGALVLTRENAVVLVAGVAAWIALERGGEAPRRRVASIAALLAGLALVLLPVALRNLAVGGELVVTSSQAGRNFYYGNNPRADGTYRPLRSGRGEIRFEAADARELAEQALGRALSEREVSRYWAARAFDWIRDEPRAWARLMLRKARLLVNRVEVMDTEDQVTHRDHVPVARWLGAVLHFGVLFPLAVLGAALCWREPGGGRRRLLAWMIAGYAGSVWIFFVLDRYRYPLVPLLALFAGAGIARLPQALRASPRRRAALLAAVAAAALAANVPAMASAPMRALTYVNLGVHFGERGALDAAIRYLRLGLSHAPGSASAHYNLGLYLARRGALEEALGEQREALRLHPAHAKAALERDRLLAVLGRREAAAAAVGRAPAPGD